MSDNDIRVSSIPSHARALTALGDETTRAVNELFAGRQSSLFGADDTPELGELSAALAKGWSDHEAAALIRAYSQQLNSGRSVDIKSLARWALAHRNNAAAVVDCMNVNPPAEIDIIRVLSRAGSQKLVFLAKWRLTQQEVVLKQVVAEAEDAQRIFLRELQPHPLTMAHPNIIETHVLRNSEGDPFLVEQRLPLVLNDEWSSQGMHEAANLLYDIARAIKHLHDSSLVHGDVKPDNIGKRGENYILLDFGICRPADQFSIESTPTGSLRTRAPELLAAGRYIEPYKVDVWAIGATIFNAFVGRFPLFKLGESIPRVSSPRERDQMESVLAKRVENEWEKWIDMRTIPEPLRSLLRATLTKDPRERISSADLVERARTELSAFLRSSSPGSGRFSPVEELNQLRRYLPERAVLGAMPIARRQSLRNRIGQLQRTPGFSQDQQQQISELMALLS